MMGTLQYFLRVEYEYLFFHYYSCHALFALYIFQMSFHEQYVYYIHYDVIMAFGY
jgi:hypothetical protein